MLYVIVLKLPEVVLLKANVQLLLKEIIACTLAVWFKSEQDPLFILCFKWCLVS